MTRSTRRLRTAAINAFSIATAVLLAVTLTSPASAGTLRSDEEFLVFPAERGDWSGDYRADLLAVTDGQMKLYTSRQDGFARAVPVTGKAARDWRTSNWVGSAGDVDADGHADLMHRVGGSLYLVFGAGGGHFDASVLVGTGFGKFTALATPGDINADGWMDLLVRGSDGVLLRYSMTSSNRSTAGDPQVRLRAAGPVGRGWNGMVTILGTGDWSGDGLADLVGVTADGRMYGYHGRTSGGLEGIGQIGRGWTRMSALAAPGDWNSDGLADMFGVDADGKLRFYYGHGGGHRGGYERGFGWAGVDAIL